MYLDKIPSFDADQLVLQNYTKAVITFFDSLADPTSKIKVSENALSFHNFNALFKKVRDGRLSESDCSSQASCAGASNIYSQTRY